MNVTHNALFVDKEETYSSHPSEEEEDSIFGSAGMTTVLRSIKSERVLFIVIPQKSDLTFVGQDNAR